MSDKRCGDNCNITEENADGVDASNDNAANGDVKNETACGASIESASNADAYIDEAERKRNEFIGAQLKRILGENALDFLPQAFGAFKIPAAPRERETVAPQEDVPTARGLNAFPRTDVTVETEDGAPVVREDPRKGHRERIRAAATKDRRLDTFSDAELVEALLSYVVPRKDTGEIAHGIIERWTPAELLDFTDEALDGVSGVTEAAKRIIRAIGHAGIWSGVSECTLDSKAKAAEYFAMVLFGNNGAGTHAVFLDKKFRVVAHEKYVEQKAIDARKIVGGAYGGNAAYVLIARRERELFFSLSEYAAAVDDINDVLKVVGAKILDFFVFTDFGYYSTSAYETDRRRCFAYTPLAAISAAPELCEMLTRSTLEERRREASPQDRAARGDKENPE